jgi:predicted GH43/DUF377 family glycosyl hydrolase
MIAVKKEGVLLRKAGFEFENEGVLNPAVIVENNQIYLFYRAVRKGNYSTIGYCKLTDPITVSTCSAIPVLASEFDYESHGLEDPRIVKIDGLFYLSYIAYDGKDALGALATSVDLVNWQKQGIIVPQIQYTKFIDLVKDNDKISPQYLTDNYDVINRVVMDKDLVFFPRRINGKLTFFHRVKPDIQITAVKDLSELTPAFWEDYFAHLDQHIVLRPKYDHEVKYIGGGCPPVETEHAWLVIYHGVKDCDKGLEYSACAALLDLDNPLVELARLPYPLFKPELDYELTGDVDDVVFPTGTALFDDTLYIYYGAADDIIAVASVSIAELLAELLNHSN